MYLIDTNVISEIRKKNDVNSGLIDFFKRAIEQKFSLFISVITLGKIGRGINVIRHRSDTQQAHNLEKWLQIILINIQKIFWTLPR